MPLYEYQCQQCGQRSEVLQRYDDAPLTTCSNCGGPLKKLISSPAFQFKGSGWYVTDYARSSGGAKDSGPSAKTDGGDSSGSAKETSSSETPAAKPSAETGGASPAPKAPAKE